MIGKLTAEEIEEVLLQNLLGRLGCNDGFTTYVIPINYVYDAQYIIAHSQPGLKIQVMRQNPRVCFEVDEIKNFTNWKSVVIIGEFQELTDERDRYNAIKIFTSRMLHKKISETALLSEIPEQHMQWSADANARPVIYRIVIEEKNGRYEME